MVYDTHVADPIDVYCQSVIHIMEHSAAVIQTVLLTSGNIDGISCQPV